MPNNTVSPKIGPSILMGFLLGFLSFFSTSPAHSCTSASSCEDCGYFPTTGKFECADVQRDAYCSCSELSSGTGCDLGTETCDYTGSGGNCGGMDECPDQRVFVPMFPQTLSQLTVQTNAHDFWSDQLKTPFSDFSCSSPISEDDQLDASSNLSGEGK